MTNQMRQSVGPAKVSYYNKKHSATGRYPPLTAIILTAITKTSSYWCVAVYIAAAADSRVQAVKADRRQTLL